MRQPDAGTGKIIAIIGPTASGKSHLAMQLAEQLQGEIISVDSAQIYKGMTIGTAKPTAQQQQQIPHHLIDLLSPWQSYSAAQFVSDASNAIKDIQQRNKNAILCGGTMLYFKSLTQGLNDLPSHDPAIRQQLNQQWQNSPEQVYQQLQQLDPNTATKLHSQDRQRIIRAIEICLQTNKPYSQQLKSKIDFSSIITPDCTIALAISNRTLLHQRINQRFEQMMQQGLLQEVQALYQHPKLKPQQPQTDLMALKAVGYRQLWQYCNGECDLNQAIENAKTATRRLAKRQNTWLNSIDYHQTIEFDHPQLLQTAFNIIQQTCNLPTP